MSAVTVDNELVHYEVLGRGRPVIFVHGWLGSWRYWIPTMQQLAVKFRTYALDLWGFGDSSKSFAGGEDRYGLEHQVALLRQFMERMGIERAAMVGHGLGGTVVVKYAAGNPGRVPRAIAISSPVMGGWLTPDLNNPSLAQLTSLAARAVSDSSAQSELEAEIAKVDVQAVIRSALNIRGEDTGNGAPIDLRPLLFDILDMDTTPPNMVMLLHGTQDALVRFPDDDSLDALDQHDRFVFIELEDSRHFPMVDATAKVTRLITAFLELQPGQKLKDLQPKDQWRRRMR
ncbi:MAG: alpha/beta hydrolase [Anaerolineae bacterium]|nr:alpha/beta hydrolase [Anaerolineae bacterium]